jgi:hypothetical protein
MSNSGVDLVKSEYYLLYFFGFSLFSVILWYVLQSFQLQYSVEISVFVFILLAISLITYALHGKGILPSPERFYRRSNTDNKPRYLRKKFTTGYSRETFGPENYERPRYTKNYELELFSDNYNRQQYRK